MPLLKEFKTAEEAKNIAVAGGISLQLAAEKRQESLSNKISKLKEEYLELFRKITESKSFMALANTMLSVASSFAKVLDYARPLLPLLTTLAAVKIGTNLGTIGGAFTRAFVAPPGAIVSGARTGAGTTRFSEGGSVPGSGNTDTVRAVLTPGEFVVKKQAAERIGYHKHNGMNERPERFTTRAYGGDIFRPVGTDTVTAMLTPGEFVINARSASVNAALLHQINEARGPDYLANGGMADYDRFAADSGSRAAQNEAQRQA
ncbi:hypothetical protein [Gemmata obscuriglobus]|uniref:hypothetical protein n=1 Tax=Gemmata obscuriglobus TaxID=114 RepID=UPI0002D7CE61|nr:hypothetical protein [Gemmata obscuriglobus]